MNSSTASIVDIINMKIMLLLAVASGLSTVSAFKAYDCDKRSNPTMYDISEPKECAEIVSNYQEPEDTRIQIMQVYNFFNLNVEYFH